MPEHPPTASTSKRPAPQDSGEPSSSSRKAKSAKRGGGGGPGPGNRNQQIVSCLECRRNKWKCDRNFPCSNCRKRGLEGMCPEGQLTSAKDNQELVKTLQGRVAELESVIQKLTTGTTSLLISEGETLPGGSTADSAERREDHGQLILGEEPGSSRYFGGAGAAYLVRERSDVLVPNPSDPETGVASLPPDAYDDYVPIPFIQPLPVNHTLEDLQAQLPERGVAEQRARVYFEDGSFINNILDPVTFSTCFLDAVYPLSPAPGSISLPAEKVNNHRLAVVFLVLAIGSQMDVHLPPYNEVGEGYMHLARAALAHNPSSSTPFIQAIHLMSRYQVNTTRGATGSEGFWSTLGFGVRCAQQIGLHRDGEKWGLEGEEVELRRRVFWEIHTEDIMQSLTQGRPRLVIHDSNYDTAMPSVTESMGFSPRFHHQKYRLATILAKVNDLQMQVTPSSYQKVFEVDKMLREYESGLPPELNHDFTQIVVSSPDLLSSRDSYQRLILKLLIQEGFLFLHRNHFARALRDHLAEPLNSPFRFSFVSQLESSRVVLGILRDALALNASLTSRYWIFFFHAFSAIVFFAATVIRSPTSSLAGAAFGQIEEGIRLFESVKLGFKARSDLPTLRQLLERARAALYSSQDPTNPDDSEDLLGVGTTLHRIPPKSTPVAPPGPAGPAPADPNLTLPTTLEDAVAVQDDLLLGVPWEGQEWGMGTDMGMLGGWAGSSAMEAQGEKDDEFDWDALLANIGVNHGLF
ncbi:hypothetical protein IAT38_005471 [Cryptococcus sp. DSM 104549]